MLWIKTVLSIHTRSFHKSKRTSIVPVTFRIIKRKFLKEYSNELPTIFPAWVTLKASILSSGISWWLDSSSLMCFGCSFILQSAEDIYFWASFKTISHYQTFTRTYSKIFFNEQIPHCMSIYTSNFKWMSQCGYQNGFLLTLFTAFLIKWSNTSSISSLKLEDLDWLSSLLQSLKNLRRF